MNEYEPDWANRYNHTDHRPDWVDLIPHGIWELGKVFFPIPPGVKGWDYLHHLDEFRYTADDKILNAYLEAGYGYGISCSHDILVIDIDDLEYMDNIYSQLPDTIYQYTGSGDGVHLFYYCDEMDSRFIFHYEDVHDCDRKEHTCRINKTGNCIRLKDWTHLGEVKCDPHGYVIGPGSLHPSGNRYGPVEGEKIATVSKDEVMDALEDYNKPEDDNTRGYPPNDPDEEYRGSDSDNESKHEFYNIGIDDVVPWLERGKRVPHPVHGSDTGKNFMKSDEKDVFICWRHNYGKGQGCAFNAQQLLAIMETGRDCDEVRRNWSKDPVLHWKAWKKAIDDDLVSFDDVPYMVALGYAFDVNIIKHRDELRGDVYYDTINAIKTEMLMRMMPDEPVD